MAKERKKEAIEKAHRKQSTGSKKTATKAPDVSSVTQTTSSTPTDQTEVSLGASGDRYLPKGNVTTFAGVVYTLFRQVVEGFNPKAKTNPADLNSKTDLNPKVLKEALQTIRQAISRLQKMQTTEAQKAPLSSRPAAVVGQKPTATKTATEAPKETPTPKA